MGTTPPGRGAEVRPTRLNPTDATLWDIERNPTLRTTIVAAMLLDRPIAHDRLLNGLEAASRLVPRLRQRVVSPPAGIGAPHWELDERFALVGHVSFVELPDPMDDAALAAVATPIASAVLDRTRPLWHCTYVAGPTARSALVLQVHHSLTDGVGGIDLLDVMLDRDRDAPPRDLDTIPVPRAAAAADLAGDRLERVVDRAVAMPFDVAERTVTAAFHPRRTVQGVVGGARSAARLVAPTSASRSPLMTGRSMERSVGWCDVDLARIHDAAARHDCTVNHAFFAGAVAGIADYHRELGAPANDLRITMPVSVRRSGDATGGNRWVPVRFLVPADVDDPVERMLAMRERVVSRRQEKALSFSHVLAGMIQVLPSVLSSGVVAGMTRGIDATFTNVPGLTEPHYLGGALVERIYAFPPTAGAALNIGLVSHLGTACIGILSDDAAVSQPALLRDLVAAGLDEVVATAERTAPSPTATPVAALGPATERLSALDTAFLRLETAATPMHIGGVFVFDPTGLRGADGEIRLADVRRHVEARLQRIPRFTCRVEEVPFGLGRPLWVDDDRFDVREHVRLVELDGDRDRHALADLCAELFTAPLDRSRPLWELWLVDGLADGRVGIVEKIHHALIDGVSGVELAGALFDAEPTPQPDRPTRRRPRPTPGPLRRLVDASVEQIADPVATARRTASAAASAPGDLFARIGAAATAGRDLLDPSAQAPPTAFNRPVGLRRVLRIVDLDLATVHRVRASRDATVNDVVLGCVAGGMRRWFAAEGDPAVDVHVLVPVSTRHGAMVDEPGNRVGGVVLTLPVGEPDAERRIRIVGERMRRLKAVHEGEGTATLLDAVDHLPAVGYGALIRLVAAQPLVNFVVTNVFGPPAPLYFLGARLEEMVPVVPLGPRMGLGIAVLSYGDRLIVSMFADPELCRDLDVLAAAISDELDVLAAG